MRFLAFLSLLIISSSLSAQAPLLLRFEAGPTYSTEADTPDGHYAGLQLRYIINGSGKLNYVVGGGLTQQRRHARWQTFYPPSTQFAGWSCPPVLTDRGRLTEQRINLTAGLEYQVGRLRIRTTVAPSIRLAGQIEYGYESTGFECQFIPERLIYARPGEGFPLNERADTSADTRVVVRRPWQVNLGVETSYWITHRLSLGLAVRYDTDNNNELIIQRFNSRPGDDARWSEGVGSSALNALALALAVEYRIGKKIP